MTEEVRVEKETEFPKAKAIIEKGKKKVCKDCKYYGKPCKKTKEYVQRKAEKGCFEK